MRNARITRRRLMQAAIATSASVALPAFAQGGAYPNRPIKLICPWPAGGATDG